MEANQNQLQTEVKNDDYLTVWQIEQEHVRARWTIATFFIGISFAVFGYSFQNSLAHPSALAIRISALFIYWFGYFTFIVYNGQTKFLRAYLLDMEISRRTTLDIQTKARAKKIYASRGIIGVHGLLLAFGVIYILSIALFWILGL